MAKTALIEVDLSGKTALVTGATGGIGKELARGLARMGADVVLGARSREKGEAARADIAKSTGSRRISVGVFDVAEGASIRRFAASFAREHATLDLLVNNAGSWFTERRANAEGRELTLATNVLGPYQLTSLLLDALRRAPSGRVVNVVSSITGSYDGEDLEFAARKYDGFKAYAQSKTALRMLTWGLASALAGSTVTANAAAPGFVRTDLNRNASGLIASFINVSAKLFAVSPEAGADTPLWVAVSPEVAGVNGKYFAGRKEKPRLVDDPGAIAALERRCQAWVTPEPPAGVDSRARAS